MSNREIYAARDEFYDPQPPLRRGINGVCCRSKCVCELEGLGDQCIWLRAPDDPVFEQPIHTSPADLDEANHETEGAAGFVVGLIVIVLAACGGWWAVIGGGWRTSL